MLSILYFLNSHGSCFKTRLSPLSAVGLWYLPTQIAKKDGNGTYHYFTRMCLLILSSSRVISWSNSESTSHRWGFNSYKSWPISTLHTCTQRKNVGDSCFGKIRFTVDRGQSWTNLQDLRNYTIKTVRDTFSQPYQWFLVGITKSQMAG